MHPYRRATYQCITAIAACFLVALGMRIAAIKGDFHKPKPKPRAIVEDVVELKEKINNKSNEDPSSVAVVSAAPIIPLRTSFPARFSALPPAFPQHIPLFARSSRAPPALI